MEQLKDYIYYACQRRFGDQLIDIKVNGTIPNQAHVQIVVETVTPEIKTFAVDLEKEFAELGRHITTQVVSGWSATRISDRVISAFRRFMRPS